jgi:hypothetical protein
MSELVGQVDAKWIHVLESVEDIRCCLRDALKEMGHISVQNSDLEQFERLILLGESACANDTMSHFLSSKIGRFKFICCPCDGRQWEEGARGRGAKIAPFRLRCSDQIAQIMLTTLVSSLDQSASLFALHCAHILCLSVLHMSRRYDLPPCQG